MFSKDYKVFLPYSRVEILVAILSLSILTESIFLDGNCYEYFGDKNFGLYVEFFFFIINKYRLFICTRLSAEQTLNSMTQFFQALEWLEREMSEFFGLEFLHKKDSRVLLLDYQFFGFPLLKSFPLSGYSEIFYDLELGWLRYRENYSDDEDEVLL